MKGYATITDEVQAEIECLTSSKNSTEDQKVCIDTIVNAANFGFLRGVSTGN